MKILTAVLALTFSASLIAAPAPWFKWRSKQTRDETCAQVMTGDWERISGPYKDAQCQTPGVPGP